jgi:flagellar operon protein
MVHETTATSNLSLTTGKLPAAASSEKSAGSVGTFEQQLASCQSQVAGSVPVKFSAHATERLAQRNVRLSSQDLDRIAQAADKAAAKGSKDSLFLLDNLGLIVNVKNRTVLTALDSDRLREGIVTDIDSTVIIPKF